MSRSPARLALVAVLVALAGCTYGVGGASPAAPNAGGDATPVEGPATGVSTVSLENSSLSLPADSIFARVETLTGEDVQAPPVQVLRGRSAGGGAFSFPQTPYGFVEDMGMTGVAAGGDSAAGMTDGFGQVFLVAGDATRVDQTKVLVHEYVHVVQIRGDLLPWDLADLQGNVPTDEAQTKLALTEGAAVWVTDRYVERHMGPNVTLQSTEMARAYESARVGGRFFVARYHFGAQGVDHRVDDPSQLRDLYRGPLPETTEQLIHGYAPSEEPMDRVAVDATGGGGWTVDDPDDEDRLGELFVRVALSKELSLDAAAAAADGWGYDRLLEFERDDASAFAWVTRWDDAANATAFESAFRTYADRRQTGPDQAFRTARVDDETVVVYSGPPTVVAEATATVENGTVHVAVGGS